MDVPPLYKEGDKCPAEGCSGTFDESGGLGFAYQVCSCCGYCPENEFDGQIENCPLCGAFSHIINQGNIVCSGCPLELTAENETTAIMIWNRIQRTPKESNT